MAPPFFCKLVQWIREEFEEFPDLRLTVTEAARFFGLDPVVCERVLLELNVMGFLTMDADRRYQLVPFRT